MSGWPMPELRVATTSSNPLEVMRLNRSISILLIIWVLLPSGPSVSEIGTLKVNKPQRIALSRVDRDESKVGTALHAIPGPDRSAFAGHHCCRAVDPCHELTR